MVTGCPEVKEIPNMGAVVLYVVSQRRVGTHPSEPVVGGAGVVLLELAANFPSLPCLLLCEFLMRNEPSSLCSKAIRRAFLVSSGDIRGAWNDPSPNRDRGILCRPASLVAASLRCIKNYFLFEILNFLKSSLPGVWFPIRSQGIWIRQSVTPNVLQFWSRV